MTLNFVIIRRNSSGESSGFAPGSSCPSWTLVNRCTFPYTGKCRKHAVSSRISMPKLKTHKGAAKRFKKTGTGKIVRGQSKMRHVLTSKETKTKRKLAHSALVSDADHAKVARMIPYA